MWSRGAAVKHVKIVKLLGKVVPELKGLYRLDEVILWLEVAHVVPCYLWIDLVTTDHVIPSQLVPHRGSTAACKAAEDLGCAWCRRLQLREFPPVVEFICHHFISKMSPCFPRLPPC